MWIWFHQGNPRLPESVAEEILHRRSDVAISAVTVWETVMTIQRGRIEVPNPPDTEVRRWMDRVPMKVIPVDMEIAVLSRTLAFVHDDPADRFIAATAHRLGVPLATVDRNLSGLPWLRVIG